MAWECVRCQKKIFAPRKGSFNFVMEWKYVKSQGELLLELRNLKDIKHNSVITHLSCEETGIGSARQWPLFKNRMREALKMPKNSVHPLL